MTSEQIRVGDTVEWYQQPVWPHQPGRMATGTVLLISHKPISRPFATIANKYGQRFFVNLDKLTRVTSATLVSAAQAACDDQTREDAIASLRAAVEE